MDPVTTPVLNPKYGAASKYDFDNPQKWHTEPSVPLLDEHEMTNEDGKPVAFVDRSVLQEIANNNNRRVRETGDPATLILGHTSDDPRAEEKPAKGFVVNYQVKPFKRDPQTGRMVFAIHGDYKVRPQNANLIEQYPRRSVELWWNKKELDPIAMLGGTSPERDLSVVIRHSRLKHVAILGGSTPHRDLGGTLRLSRGAIDMEIDHVLTRRRFTHTSTGPVKRGEAMSNNRTPAERVPNKYGMGDFEDDSPEQYMAGDEGEGDFDAGDESPDPGNGPDSAENDPMLAKIFQSKQWKDLSAKLDMIAQAIAPEAGQEPGMGGEMSPPGAPGMDAPGGAPPMAGPGMDAPGGAPPMGGADGMDFGDEASPEEQDARQRHGANPVQFNAPSTGLPGPMNTNIPTTRKKMSRNGTPAAGSPVQNGRRPQPTNNNPVLLRMSALEKQNRGLHLKLARAEVVADMRTLKDEGILFGATPEVQATKEAEHIELLANLKLQGEDHYQCELDNIRTCYARKKPNPAAPVYPGVARFARGQVGTETVENAEDFEPETPQEACTLADMMTLKKMSRVDAVKAIRLQRGQS